jgi:phospholipase/lecithinase/hemolysin
MARRPIDFQHLAFFGDSLTDGHPPPAGTTPVGSLYSGVLPTELGVASSNFALAGAKARTDEWDSAYQASINLTAQVDAFLSSAAAPVGDEGDTAALIWIGGNDYPLFSPPATPEAAAAFVNGLVASHADAVAGLTAAGVDRIVLFNQFSLSSLPIGGFLPPEATQAADAVVGAYNAALQAFAAGQAEAGPGITLVDVNRLLNEIGGDMETFGIRSFATPLYVPDPATGQLVPTGIGAAYGTGAVAFHDLSHPTEATHGIIAAFAEATITSDRVELRGAAKDKIVGTAGHELVFAGAGADIVRGEGGDDVIFAGTGNDIAEGAAGNDLIAAGGGNDELAGGTGTDLLAGNAGADTLKGGAADDVLIGGGGADRTYGDGGNDVIVFVEDGLGNGIDCVDGGAGIDTLRISVTAAFLAASGLQEEVNRFAANPCCATFRSLDLNLTSVERVEILVDGTLVRAAGAAAPVANPAMAGLMRDADLWGLV